MLTDAMEIEAPWKCLSSHMASRVWCTMRTSFGGQSELTFEPTHNDCLQLLVVRDAVLATLSPQSGVLDPAESSMFMSVSD